MTSPEDRRSAAADVTDAYWQVPASDYLPKGPAPERSIVDEPRRRLELIWNSTVQTLHEDAPGDAKAQVEVERRLAVFAERVEERQRQLAAATPPEAADSAQRAAITEPKHTGLQGLALRVRAVVARIALVQRTLTHRS